MTLAPLRCGSPARFRPSFSSGTHQELLRQVQPPDHERPHPRSRGARAQRRQNEQLACGALRPQKKRKRHLLLLICVHAVRGCADGYLLGVPGYPLGRVSICAPVSASTERTSPTATSGGGGWRGWPPGPDGAATTTAAQRREDDGVWGFCASHGGKPRRHHALRNPTTHRRRRRRPQSGRQPVRFPPTSPRAPPGERATDPRRRRRRRGSGRGGGGRGPASGRRLRGESGWCVS